MARAGITYSEVAKAAMRLYEENQTISADNIRNLIGSGSKTTIVKHLNAWKDGHALEAQANGVPISLLEALKGIWTLVKDEADQVITKHLAEADEEIEAMEGIVKRAQEQEHILRRETANLQASLTNAEIKIQELTAFLQAERTENTRLIEQKEGLERQYAQQNEEIIRQHQIVKQTQANLEHYQAANLKLKEADSLEREKERNQFQHTIRALESQVNTLQRDKAMLDHTLKHADETLTDAREAIEQLQCICQELTNEASESKTKIALLEHQNQTLLNQTSKQEQQLKESSEQLCNALNQISSLQNKQELLEGSLHKAEDKAQALLDEKLFLVQDRAEMIGQLKNLQSE